MVTGGSSGIGLEVARLLASRGAHLVLVARGSAGLEDAAATCIAAGARSARVLACDVGDDEAVTAAVESTIAQHGRLDAVVNAAGVFAGGPLSRIPVEVFDAVLRTNLLGSANVARAALPVLRRQGGGTLVLFGSLLGHVTAPYLAPYVVSKWGVRALARSLQAEYDDAPAVRIGYVAPAGVATPLYERAANYLGHPMRPPPPLTPASVVARDVVDILDGRRRVRVRPPVPRLFHLVARAGFRLLPAPAYDAVAGTLVTHAGLERDRRAAPDPGAALGSLS